MNIKTKVGQAYEAESIAEQQSAYDDWAGSYENDLCNMGYRIPAAAAAVFARFVKPPGGPILDAGCGGGIQAEPLVLAGFGPITGIDLSDGMLEVARAKGIYTELRQMALGGKLDFADEHFAVVFSTGTITPKHAPPESFDDLIRITKTGGKIIFSMRNDAAQEPEYPAAVQRHVDAGNWRVLYSTEGFHSMPYGEPEISHQIHVCEKL
ncbi:MAG: class I SAM-dependent methyltransferase [Pseudomonadota bacterium]